MTVVKKLLHDCTYVDEPSLQDQRRDFLRKWPLMCTPIDKSIQERSRENSHTIEVEAVGRGQRPGRTKLKKLAQGPGEEGGRWPEMGSNLLCTAV